jgi:Fungal specific transcription factor domain
LPTARNLQQPRVAVSTRWLGISYDNLEQFSRSSFTTTSSWEKSRDFLHTSLRANVIEQEPQEQILQDPWTVVTSSSEIIENLLSMYFCWEFPNFVCISKKHLFEDFRIGRRRYCSPLLVNAMLALGARFTDQPEIRVSPNNNDTVGCRFYAEAERLWAAEQDRASLTTIQALNLMSYWEQSCGKEDKAWFYSTLSICMAIEMGLHLPVDVQISAAE